MEPYRIALIGFTDTSDNLKVSGLLPNLILLINTGSFLDVSPVNVTPNATTLSIFTLPGIRIMLILKIHLLM